MTRSARGSLGTDSRARHIRRSSIRLVPLGYYPICVQGGGAGGGIRFAVIFAKQDAPLPRQWTAVGVGPRPRSTRRCAAPWKPQTSGARRSPSSATRGSYSRGATRGRSPATRSFSDDRVPPCECVEDLAAVAAHQLVAAGKLALTDTVQSILGLTTPSGAAPPDPDFASITVEDLLLHRSRLEPNFYWSDAAVAAAFGLGLPVTEAQLASLQIRGQRSSQRRPTTTTGAMDSSAWSSPERATPPRSSMRSRRASSTRCT